MKNVLSKIYAEDRENLVYFVEFVESEFDIEGLTNDIDECIYLHHIGKTLWGDIQLNVSIKHSRLFDEKDRVLAARAIESDIEEHIRDTYGSDGEGDLKLYFGFCDLEHNGCG